jgi:predicted  nucleic acid-binding Zn-ribbon protein
MDQIPFQTDHLQQTFASLSEADRCSMVGQAIYGMLFAGGQVYQWVTTSQNLTALDQLRHSITDMSAADKIANLREQIQRLKDLTTFDPKICSTLECCAKSLDDTSEENVTKICGVLDKSTTSECERLAKDMADKTLRLQAIFGLFNVFVGIIKLKNAMEILDESAAKVVENRNKLAEIRHRLNATEVKLPTLLQMIEEGDLNSASTLAHDCREDVQDCINQVMSLKTSVEGSIVTVKHVLNARRLDAIQHSVSAISNAAQLAQLARFASSPWFALSALMITATSALAIGDARAYYLSSKQIDQLEDIFREIVVVEDQCRAMQRKFKSIAHEIAARQDRIKKN